MVVTPVVHGATVATRASSGGIETAHSVPEKAPHLTSAKAFLLTRPLGVYTCGRAVPRAESDDEYHLVLWLFHLARLKIGLQRELDGHAVDGAIMETLQATTTTLIHEALRASTVSAPEHTMVTALWSVDCTTIHIDVHVCPMPQVKALTSNVLVQGKPRPQAECKHTRWITDRVALEQQQNDLAASLGIDLHESVLSKMTEDGDRLLLEGLITNFFVVKDGCVYTAATDVLAGSTRAMVLHACESLGIPVVLQAPRLSQITTWDAAFVTSAVRIVVPVALVLWVDANGVLQRHALNTEASELTRLRTHICDVWASW